MKHIIIYSICLLLAGFAAMPSYAQKKKSTARKTTRTTQQSKNNRGKASSKKQKNAVTYTNASIRKLQSQRADIQRKIREQEKGRRRTRLMSARN